MGPTPADGSHGPCYDEWAAAIVLAGASRGIHPDPAPASPTALPHPKERGAVPGGGRGLP